MTILRRGVVGVLADAGRLLVIRRAQCVRAPGKYCFPGGAIEPGETEEQALVRELAEELAADVRPVRRLWESVTPWGVHLAWWLSELVGDSPPMANPAEVEFFRWLTPEEMSALPELLESNRGFLAALAAGDFGWSP